MRSSGEFARRAHALFKNRIAVLLRMRLPLQKFLWHPYVLLLGAFGVSAQVLPEKGVPLIQNFTPAQYHKKGKIWDIDTAPNGMVYMAADKGLLEFDGKDWKSFKGSKGSTRSLLVWSDSLIYTGSDLDFGLWKKDSCQGFIYKSLYPFQEVVQNINEEFWEIHRLGQDIVFVSSQNIYVQKAQQLVKIPAPKRFSKSFLLNDTLYLADETLGLYAFDGYALVQIFTYPNATKWNISGIYRDSTGLIVVTRDLGLYRYALGKLSRLSSRLSEVLKAAKVFCFEPIGEAYWAFGTVLKGLYIADKQGNIIHHVNKYKGLPSNTVLSIHYSTAGKLWLGMDYGASALNLKSRFTTFYDYRGDFGAGSAAVLEGETFYLGTNQGLYRSPWKALNNNLEFFHFQLVPGTEGQVWSLDNIGGEMFMGHDKGLFRIKKGIAEKLDGPKGVWTAVPLRGYLLTGNYNGISIFRKTGDKWAFLKKMELIAGSCNQLLCESEEVLWVNIPNFGVIRTVLDAQLYPIDRLIFAEDNFVGDNLRLFQDERGVHVLTEQNAYLFSLSERRFVLESQVPAFAKASLPYSLALRSLHRDYDFCPSDNGFLLKHRKLGSPADHKNCAVVVFREINAFNSHYQMPVCTGTILPYELNSLWVSCAVPNCDGVLYQYKLDNSDEWSEWSDDSSIKLINLGGGLHVLLVRAKVGELVTESQELVFRVSPPWHRTWGAFAVYLSIGGLLAYAFYYWKKRSLEIQKEQLLLREKSALMQQSEAHKREISLLEQERLQAEYTQMKKNLRTKTIELAKQARENEEKNRLLLALKEKCAVAQENPALLQLKWKEMERLLDAYIKVDDQTFEIQIDELHQEFFRKLKARFPSLSSHDLRLCAYLKIGISSKEISEILNIQPSSFYISRSRLRKKLDLKADQNLYDFLNEV